VRKSFIHRKAKAKEKPKRTWDSANLRMETLRVVHMLVVGMAVCKFEHRGFERAKERWDSASLGAKDFKIH
jgi:hypothetical protein